MRHIILVICAFVCAGVLAVNGAAVGQTQQPQPGQLPPQQWQQEQQGSDQSLWTANQMVHRVIGRLQQDAHDYGGYRAKAILDLEEVAGDLEQALQYERSHEVQPQQNR